MQTQGDSMTELELIRTRTDRRLYALEGKGTVRLEGMLGRSASAEADGCSWHFDYRGFWQRVMVATDSSNAVVGEFLPRDLGRGGSLRWGGQQFTLEPTSILRERYTLNDGSRNLILLDGKGWGRRPVTITLPDPGAVEPGMLLFAAFVVHQLAVKTANATSASSTAALSSTYSGG
jgi:hypothetical protein